MICIKHQLSLIIPITIWSSVLLNAHANVEIKQNLSIHSEMYNKGNDTLVYLQRDFRSDVRKTMTINFYINNTKVLETPVTFTSNILKSSGCDPSDKFSIVLHGWIQSCGDDWALALIDRLSYYRKGCVICIDYSVAASTSYMRLHSNFDYLTNTIATVIYSLVKYGLDPSKGYLFGFSFGGQLASAVGRALQPHFTLQNIDTCDMAGPGFDPIAIDHSKAGRNVQCFHTSRDKGTLIHSCHRNIMLGSCGFSQPSVASQMHLGSHGLCVQIYINSFDYPFYALKTPPPECVTFRMAARIPNDYTVGYEENFNNKILGKIFVPTSLHYPYNLSKKEIKLLLM